MLLNLLDFVYSVNEETMDPFAYSDEHLLKYYRFPSQELLHWCARLEPRVGPATRRSRPCCAMSFAGVDHIPILCKWDIPECVGRHNGHNTGMCEHTDQHIGTPVVQDTSYGSYDGQRKVENDKYVNLSICTSPLII